MSKRSLAKRGAGQPQWSLVPMTVSYSAQPSGAGWFGPLAPMKPVAPAQIEGRAFDFPSGYNLATSPRSYEAIGFPMLRALADGYDLLRLIIETRKDQIERMEWSIRVKKSAKSKSTDARTEKIQAFFKRPDGFNPWSAWLRLILEDMFVLDAPAIYLQKSIGGDLLSLHPIDGGTIKRIIDDLGRTPTLPVAETDEKGKPTGRMIAPPAYQQVLKGLPAVNYTVEELIYQPRNPRTNKVYGYSPVEQIIMTVNIALRRQLFTLNYYTEGNIPEALVSVPETWTPAQIAEYQTYFDQIMTGDMAARRRLKFVPAGIGKSITPTKEVDQKNEFDEWLARICCFAFSVSPTPFIKQMNRATAGTQKEQSDEEGLGPVLMWIKGLIDFIIEHHLNSSDIEFVWGEDTHIEPKDEAEVLTSYVKVAGITLNDLRERLGEDPYDPVLYPMADVPMVLTAQGFVPLTAYADAQQKAADAAQAASDNLEAAALRAPAGAGSNSNDPGNGDEVLPDAGAVSSGDAAAVEKHTHHHVKPFNKRGYRKVPAIPFDRKATRVAIASMSSRLGLAFRKWGASLSKQVTAALDKLNKTESDNRDIAAAISAELEFDGLASIAHDLGIDLSDVASDSVNEVMAQIGVTDASDLVNKVSARAVATARDRAAEMVGMQWDGNDLVPNPNAEWVITETMRDSIRDTIAQGLEDNIGTLAISDAIEALGGLSADRAALIAHTEVARANSTASLDSYRAARDDLGIATKKAWLLGPEPCEICQSNADDGEIDIDDDFSSGDDAPPAHPNCECVLVPVVQEDGSTDDDVAGDDPTE